MNLNSGMTINEVLEAMRKTKETGEELTTTGLWYDWFCKTSSLENKGKNLLTKLKVIVKANSKSLNPKFDPSKTYVFFKNNCPCGGSLYDDFRICDTETGDVLYTIVPSSGFRGNKGNSELWGKDNEFNEELIDGSWKDVVEYFKN